MKTPDETKNGLSAHVELHECLVCPYRSKKERNGLCIESLLADALALIQQLQVQNAEQADRIQQLEAERDALINDIRVEGGLCALCKHEGARAWAEPCCRCNALIISGESHWEWRGVQKEESDDGKE